MKLVIAKSAKLLIVDLASPKGETEAIVEESGASNVELHRIEYDGPFLRSKALNFGVKNAQTEYVTVMDVDCMASASFFADIENYFATPDAKPRLGFNVRYTDKHTARLAKDFGYGWAKKNILDRPEKHPFCWNTRTSDGKVIGNSMFAMRRQDFIDVGGFDEGFRGHGYEDLEMGHRCHAKYGDVPLHPTALLFHLWHEDSQPGWHDAELRASESGTILGTPETRIPHSFRCRGRTIIGFSGHPDSGMLPTRRRLFSVSICRP